MDGEWKKNNLDEKPLSETLMNILDVQKKLIIMKTQNELLQVEPEFYTLPYLNSCLIFENSDQLDFDIFSPRKNMTKPNDVIVNMVQNDYYPRDYEDRYQLRERKRSSCATGSCSAYDNISTIRPNFPYENDVRSRTSFYNGKKIYRDRKGYVTESDSDFDVLYESPSYFNVGRSRRATRENSVIGIRKSELIPVINSRELGAESRFVQSRVRLMKNDSHDYRPRKRDKEYVQYYAKYRHRDSNERIERKPKKRQERIKRPTRPRSDDSLEMVEIRTLPNNQKFIYEREKGWIGPLDKDQKVKQSKKKSMKRSLHEINIEVGEPPKRRRASPRSRYPSEYSFSRNTYEEIPEKKKNKEYKKQQKRKTSFNTPPAFRFTYDDDHNIKKYNSKLLKSRSGLDKKSPSPKKSKSPSPNYEEFPSHRRDTISSSLKYSKKFSKFNEYSSDSTFYKDKTPTPKSKTPEYTTEGNRSPRKSMYFNSNSVIKNKMRNLDVAKDCKIVCDDKEKKRNYNFAKRYGRYTVEPNRLNKYLETPVETPVEKNRKRGTPETKERVSFKEPNLQPKRKDVVKKEAKVKRPCLKNNRPKFKIDTPPREEMCKECIKTPPKRHGEVSLCAINKEYNRKNKGSTTKQEIPKTESETNTRQFCHKTVLENYPDGAEHLRDYDEEFKKQPFIKSTQFNPMGHDPPSLQPSSYPKPKSRTYNYSSNEEPEEKKGRRLSPTVYIKRGAKKELGYQSKLGENYFRQKSYKYADKNPQPPKDKVRGSGEWKYSDSTGTLVLKEIAGYEENKSNAKVPSIPSWTKEYRRSESKTLKKDESIISKENKSKSEFTTRPISLASVEELDEDVKDKRQYPDNDVITTVLDGESASNIIPKVNKSQKYNELYVKSEEKYEEKNEIQEDFKESNNERLPTGTSYPSRQNLSSQSTDRINEPEWDKNAPNYREEELNEDDYKDMRFEEKDWRLQSKLQQDFKNLNNLPSEIELASDEKLLPNMVGHAAMHNWTQAENYFYSDRRLKTNYVPKIVRRHKEKVKAREAKIAQEQEKAEEKEPEETEIQIVTEVGENQEETTEEAPEIITAPFIAKRFEKRRINPHSRFDAGYEFLQTADSDVSEELEEVSKVKLEIEKPQKRESTFKKFAKLLFSSKKKKNENKDDGSKINDEASESDSDEDNGSNISTSTESKKRKNSPKRKVSFSVPLNI